MFHIISSFAEFERDIIAERTKFGMQQKAKSGVVMNRAPYGYKFVEKNLVPDNRMSVKEVFGSFLNVQSITGIARRYGYTTRGMKNLLMNKTYLGMAKFGSEWRFGNHVPLVSADLFEKVQSLIKQRER